MIEQLRLFPHGLILTNCPDLAMETGTIGLPYCLWG